MTIKDITGKSIQVTDLARTIKQCRLCKDSPFRMKSGHTVGENHTFILRQLEKIKQKRPEWRTDFSVRFFSHESEWKTRNKRPGNYFY